MNNRMMFVFLFIRLEVFSCYKDFFLIQVLLAKHKAEEKFYAIKVLHKAAIRKRNEVGVVL